MEDNQQDEGTYKQQDQGAPNLNPKTIKAREHFPVEDNQQDEGANLCNEIGLLDKTRDVTVQASQSKDVSDVSSITTSGVRQHVPDNLLPKKKDSIDFDYALRFFQYASVFNSTLDNAEIDDQVKQFQIILLKLHNDVASSLQDELLEHLQKLTHTDTNVRPSCNTNFWGLLKEVLGSIRVVTDGNFDEKHLHSLIRFTVLPFSTTTDQFIRSRVIPRFEQKYRCTIVSANPRSSNFIHHIYSTKLDNWGQKIKQMQLKYQKVVLYHKIVSFDSVFGKYAKVHSMNVDTIVDNTRWKGNICWSASLAAVPKSNEGYLIRSMLKSCLTAKEFGNECIARFWPNVSCARVFPYGCLHELLPPKFTHF